MADTENKDAAAQSAEPLSAWATWRARVRGWLRRSVWPAAGLGWIVAAWLALSGPARDPAPEPPPTTRIVQVPDTYLVDAEAQEELGEVGPESLANLLVRVDAALQEQFPQRAVELLGRDYVDDDTSLQADLQYRRGIAFEAVGDSAEAELAFRALLDGSYPERFVLAAKLGLARIWIREQRPDLALALMSDLFLTVGSEQLGQDTLGEVLHLMAQARLARAMPRTQIQWLDDRHCISVWPQLSTRYLVGILDKVPHGAEDRHVEEKVDLVELVYQHGSSPEAQLLRVNTATQPVRKLLDAVAQTTSVEVRWTDEAATAALRHSTALRTVGMSLAAVLDNLLEPLDLVWSFQEGAVTIRTRDETAASMLRQADTEAALRTLREAISLAPEHPFAPYGYLGLGNLAFREQNYERAVSMYGTLLQNYRGAGCVAVTYLNMGKAQIFLGQRAAARASFFRAADHSVGRPHNAVGYTYAGRMMLEDGEIAEAIRPLRRAVPRAATVDVRAAAALNLATAYLMDKNPRSANLVLVEERVLLERSSYRDAVVLVSAVSQFDVATAAQERMRYGRSLVSALAHVGPDGFFGDQGILVLGDAYFRVGLVDQMARLYAHALERALPPELERQVRFQLADYWVSVGGHAKGLKILESLQDAPRPSLARAVRLKMAELLLADEQYDRAYEVCLWLLGNPGDDAQRRQTLKILGHVYEARDEYEKATQCFAGLVPPDDAHVVPKDVFPSSEG